MMDVLDLLSGLSLFLSILVFVEISRLLAITWLLLSIPWLFWLLSLAIEHYHAL